MSVEGHNTPATAQSVQPQKILTGVVAGGAVFLVIMLSLVGVAIWMGWIRFSQSWPVDLRTWMLVQFIGGFVASVLAGWVCRRVAGHPRGPLFLAAGLFLLGGLEAVEIFFASGRGWIQTPLWPVIIGPFAAAAGVLAGGWRRSIY